MLLLAQKSKPVAVGRKRRRHELAGAPGQVDLQMQEEELKYDPGFALAGAQQIGGNEPKRGKRNRAPVYPDGAAAQ